MKTFFISNPIKFLGARPFHKGKECTYSSLILASGNDLDIRKPIKTNIKIFTIPLNELTEFEFIKLLQLNLNLDTMYTILFQYTLYEKNSHLMLGPQVGIKVKETHNFKYYRNLYEHFLEILEITMDRYNVESLILLLYTLKS